MSARFAKLLEKNHIKYNSLEFPKTHFHEIWNLENITKILTTYLMVARIMSIWYATNSGRFISEASHHPYLNSKHWDKMSVYELYLIKLNPVH